MMSNRVSNTSNESRVPYFSQLRKDCRMDSHGVVDRTINIEKQTFVAKETYAKLLELYGKYWSGNIPMNETDFIRMWKTLILKRVQDVYYHEKLVKANNNIINLNSKICVPAPLWDLLNALGQFKSTATGATYDAVPPECPDFPPDWWTVDLKIANQWVQTMNKMSAVYKMCEFPLENDFQNKSIMLTTVNQRDITNPNSGKTVRSVTNECTALDSSLRWIHDDFIENSNGLKYEDCHFYVFGPFTYVVRSNVKHYVSSYVLKK